MKQLEAKEKEENIFHCSHFHEDLKKLKIIIDAHIVTHFSKSFSQFRPQQLPNWKQN